MSSQPPEDGAEPAVDHVAPDGAEPAVDAVAADEAADGAVPPWRAKAGRVWHYARWPVYAGAVGLLLFFLAFAWLWSSTELPPAAALGDSAVLLDRNGEELAVLAQDGLRFEVTLEEMAPHVPDALVAAEDRRFFDHDGIDPIGIVRAVWNNVTDNDIEGGSTITQQLVKNVYLDSDRTVTRKVREAILAMKLEQDSSKREILERYLNTVYFGRGAYGIEAAARTYFDTTAAELRPEQTALLVGILRSPERLDPGSAADEVKRRRDAVLGVMAEMGTLEPEAARAAQQVPVAVAGEVSPTTLSAGVAAHFVEQVRRDVVEEYGEAALYDRGLVVHTTLDVADQRAAEEAVAAHLDDPAEPQAAVVGIDRSGAIRAWVGGRDFETLKVDLVTGQGGSGRQPGSTFKPLVLAANFEAGFGAGQRFAAPAEITLNIPPEPWTVSNAGGSEYGELTLFDATVNSVNTVYAQALVQVGPKAVADVAKRMGIDRDLDPQPSIALGTEEVSPLELATVFSTFSRSGQRIDPYKVTKIETRDGDVLFEREDTEPEQAIGPKIADTVSHVLSEAPRRGTARRAALDRPMAAKTGTTQRNADAWLAGYTPEYTAVVWMGYADGNRPMDSVDGERVQGGSIPADIWHDFMAKALEDVEPTPFPDPEPGLLADTADELTLTATPIEVDPGERVAVSGTGFHVCINGWQAVMEGPGVLVESPAEGASTESPRTAELVVPPGAPPGAYRITARCDSGTGLRPYGPEAWVGVGGADATTTTSTTSTTRPSEDKGPKDDETTTTTSSTTTTTEPDSTTTTEKGNGAR